ncbi:MAG: hypothetical protein HC841_00695 [Verrucomicrobiae bacterium]|nr:hypothetical protein [Verrucomicrobiae bacterium]
MKNKYTLFRRGEVFYLQDSATGRQTSLRTKDETEARSLLNARNEAQRQPVLNLHLARAYLAASDPALVQRTWQTVMAQLQARGKDSSRERYETVFKSPAFDGLRNKTLLETTADDFFAVFKDGRVSIVCFLKRLHNFALNLGWIAVPIIAPCLWPQYQPKERRGITRDEHESVLARERVAEWRLYLELLWHTGAAQSDAVNFKAEDIDWHTRTISYFRQKTGSLAQFTMSHGLEAVLSELPTTGVLFPNLSRFRPTTAPAGSVAAATRQASRASRCIATATRGPNAPSWPGCRSGSHRRRSATTARPSTGPMRRRRSSSPRHWRITKGKPPQSRNPSPPRPSFHHHPATAPNGAAGWFAAKKFRLTARVRLSGEGLTAAGGGGCVCRT